MKIICKPLFRIASWLADRTGGMKPLVRWKLALGTLLVGCMAAASQSCRSGIKSGTIMCYDPAAPTDSTRTDDSTRTGGDSTHVVLCYEVASPEPQPAPQKHAGNRTQPAAIPSRGAAPATDPEPVSCYKVVAPDTVEK